jgi:hypothetical protein
VIGSRKAPYLTSLAKRYASPRRIYATAHPSLPNYLALTGGDTFGIRDDCTGCRVRAKNVTDQLERAGLSWRAYMEGMPQPCFRGASAGRYVERHDPFMYFRHVRRSADRCLRVVPYTRLAKDVAGGRLPDFAWITPDLCHDMHDCSVAVGDRFLSVLVPRLLKGLSPRGYLVLTFDEGSSSVHGGGQITTIVAGPGAARGRVQATPVTHYGVLRTIEDTFGLPPLGAAADPRNGSLRGLLR